MVKLHAGRGVAFAVFRCTDPRPKPAVLARFKEALENIKLATEETKIPPETDFAVFDLPEGMERARLTGEGAGLLSNCVAMQREGANFMIRSELPNAPNAVAARDLGDCLNMLYGGTELFDAENEGRERRVMDIFYHAGSGVYASKLALDIAEAQLPRDKN